MLVTQGGRRVEPVDDHRGVRSARHRLVRVVGAAVPWGVGLFYFLTALDRQDFAGIGFVAAVALATVLGLALAWRYDRPEIVTAVVVVGHLLFYLLLPEVVIPVAGLVALWSLTMTRPPRVSLIGLGAMLALTSLNFFTTTVEDTWFTMGLSVSVWALAEAARNRVNAAHEAGLRAVSDERARIARELHDIIAHSVSVIVVQAGAAVDVFDSRPDQARSALRSIEDAGRDALRELRLLLGAVRPDATDSPSPPQPGLAQLEDLIAPLRAAGLEVVVLHEGTRATLPAGVDLSAYRIVQEAMTNTLRHARATVVEVTLRYGRGAIEIDVVDDGGSLPVRARDTAGYGLLGMRERATVLGGKLEAGPTAHGGFRVHARLPLDGEK